MVALVVEFDGEDEEEGGDGGALELVGGFAEAEEFGEGDVVEDIFE